MVGAHPEIGNDLNSLADLFLDIENGRIGVPCEGQYHSPFPLEVYDYYASGPALMHADAEFQSALKDRPSKDWYPKDKVEPPNGTDLVSLLISVFARTLLRLLDCRRSWMTNRNAPRPSRCIEAIKNFSLERMGT